MTKLAALFLMCLATPTLSSEPVPFTINTKKWSHVLDDHFISITVNPTDLLQGKVYGLAMNSTMAILKGLAPAYVRIGSADTGKYTFKRNRYSSDAGKPDDEYTVTETHWVVFNEVAQSAGLDVVVCLNAAHRIEGTKKWDTRNSLELISFSDSQGYNLTWQLGYEVQADDFSGIQYGKDLNRLRTILNAFPRYQDSKLIGPDIRVIHKKEDVDFWNDVLVEAGPILDAVTWHPRWPQPSKMKVSDNSDLGYEFPIDHLEWDRGQLSKILQKTTFKNPVWIGETKRESTGTFAEGLIWARRLVLAAKLGAEVVMKHPNLMDITHPKPEYWIALLHKRLLGKSVLETRSVANMTDLAVISHCTNPSYWSDKPEKLQDGPVTVYGVNMGGLEQKIQLKGTWTGKSQLLFQYVLTSGSDPDSVFSQMTYLNGEPLMMTDDGLLPDVIPKIKKMDRGLTLKLPPYSIGFWVVPEAKVKICQVQPHSIPAASVDSGNAVKAAPSNLQSIRDINQFLVEKLTHPESESEETPELKIEPASSESSEKEVKDMNLLAKENALPRVARRIRQVDGLDEINQQLKTIVKETQEFLAHPNGPKAFAPKAKLPKASPSTEERIHSFAEGISQAIKTTNQEEEFNRFLEDSGLKQDFGGLLVDGRKLAAPGEKTLRPFLNSQNPEGRLDDLEVKERLRRSISGSEEASPEESLEDELLLPLGFGKKIKLLEEPEDRESRKRDAVVPHNPDLKGLEQRYKDIVHAKIQDGKRKIDDIKRKIKDEAEMKPPEAVNDIQQEIIKKEIELLEKTEETVADLLKSKKKRQETFGGMIFDELSDVKGEKMTALKEMHRHHRKQGNAIVKRQAPAPFSAPLIKTVEYIEKNFNLEPESVRKIKRSLEERMGEILRSYDVKKSMETKQRTKPQKEDRKAVVRKPSRDDDRKEPLRGKSDRADEPKPPKERNIIRKTSAGQLVSKTARKADGSHEAPRERGHRGRRVEDTKWKYQDDEDDSFEMFNQSKFQDSVKKAERRRPEKPEEKTPKLAKRAPKSSQKEEETERDARRKQKEVEEEPKKKRKEEQVEEEEEVKKPEAKEEPEKTPLRNDKERRANMLKQITLMVDQLNSQERGDERAKRKHEDEDLSEEFDTDDRARKIKRRPREADEEEHSAPAPAPAEFEGMTATTQTPATTPKAGKARKLRNRLARRHQKAARKDEETQQDGESQQRKRHLAALDRPVLELDKKKFLKPKMRKLGPKFLSHGNDLQTNDKDKDWEAPEILLPAATGAPPEPPTETTTLPQNEELAKDLEEIAEEKVFLGPGSGTSGEKSETSGGGSSGRKETEGEASGETPAPTEGYIVVEPTVEPEVDEVVESTAAVPEEKPQGEAREGKENEIPEGEEAKEAKEAPAKEEGKKDFLSVEEIRSLEALTEEEPEADAGGKSVPASGESSSSEESEEVPPPPPPLLIHEAASPGSLPQVGVEGGQRTRRATHPPTRAERERAEQEDFSSEERIEKFKEMIYRKSPAKRPVKNEIRSGGVGMGADEFLRMAGSTVRVMFDDVIPEAYGQTKSKIQNMGIPEYIKEFGKIVQQMKNLDQIFLNIGEAAVKGYIRGNRADKGPYIQVISRKKRGAAEDAAPADAASPLPRDSPGARPEPVGGGGDVATPAGQEVPDRRGLSGPAGPPGRLPGEGVRADASPVGVEAPQGAPEKEAAPEKAEAAPKGVSPREEPLFDLEALADPFKTLQNTIPKIVRRIQPALGQNEAVVGDAELPWKTPRLSEDLQDKLSPWIKTTKDFIQQALATLQRQRQLSEILARESVAELVGKEPRKKSIEKREAGDEDPEPPAPPEDRETRKREARERQAQESLIRQLRGLQPGVYVVPTEEMTNIRSEQITNEAKHKSGMPNVVTLNIYYDKKTQEGSPKGEPAADAPEAKLNQDVVAYFQNKAWKTAADQYDPGAQYLTVPELNLGNPLVTPLQVSPALQTGGVFAAEPRVADLPGSRLIQYPAPAFHYPPVQKAFPPIVPNPQPAYNPVYYLPQETRLVPPPPGTKRQWREFKARVGGFPVPNYNSGWNIQYEAVPGGGRTAPKVIPGSYNKNFKLYADKKRSVGDFKADPTWSESALPFWKFFATSKKAETKNTLEKQAETASVEEESAEEIFQENRKRAKAAESKKVKATPEPEPEEPLPEEAEDKSRRKRSADDPSGRLRKRSYPHGVDFRDHDVLPEWFGTYQEIGNSLDHLPAHVRRSHIISTPWSDEEEELLGVLDAEDELSLLDLDDADDDYYYANDNTLGHLRRYPRSTDQFESSMIKSNMIYKKPLDGDHPKSKMLGMSGIKKLTDEDSSLELVTKTLDAETKTTQGEATAPTASARPEVQPTTARPPADSTPGLRPRNPHDDTFYYFFKYAYDSLVKVMKSMTQLF